MLDDSRRRRGTSYRVCWSDGLEIGTHWSRAGREVGVVLPDSARGHGETIGAVIRVIVAFQIEVPRSGRRIGGHARVRVGK